VRENSTFREAYSQKKTRHKDGLYRLRGLIWHL